jgi:hypothetical protein
LDRTVVVNICRKHPLTTGSTNQFKPSDAIQ